MKKLFFLFFLLFSMQDETFALELQVSTGALKNAKFAGCCDAGSLGWLNSAFVKLEKLPQLEILGAVEINAMSSGKWTGVGMGSSKYIIGNEVETDPFYPDSVKVRKVDTWTLQNVLGIGFVVHNTTNTEFELPQLVFGSYLFANQHLLYSLDDQWSVGLTTGLNLAFAKSYFMASFLVQSGVRYRF